MQITHAKLIQIAMCTELIWPDSRFIQGWVRQHCLHYIYQGKHVLMYADVQGLPFGPLGQCISNERTGMTSFCMTAIAGLSHKASG